MMITERQVTVAFMQHRRRYLRNLMVQNYTPNG